MRAVPDPRVRVPALLMSLVLALSLSPFALAETQAPCTVLGAAVSSAGVGNNHGVVAADFNEDGILDLAVSGQSLVGIKLGGGAGGVGNGLWGAPTSKGINGIGQSLVTSDFNGDGILDVAVTVSNRVEVLLGNGANHVGNGTLQDSVGYTIAGTGQGLAVGDFNEDGIEDLVATNTSTASVSVLLGNGANGVGNGTFAAPVNYAVGTSPARVATGDFNEDGILDLAVTSNSAATHGVSILLGQGTGDRGNGTFAAGVSYLVNGNPWGVATGDFNEDGITDLAVASSGVISFAILLGNGAGGVGNGTFAAAVYYGGTSSLRDIAVGDFNQDGIADLVAADATSDAVLYFQGLGSGAVGNGTFAAAVTFPAGTDPFQIAVGDFLEDGLPDVVASNSNPGSISRFAGVCTGSTSGTITVSVPNGNETLLVPKGNIISWSKGAGVIAVNVEVSRDGGANYQTIARNLTSVSFPWTTSGPSTAKARVRVTDATLWNRTDASNGDLTVCSLLNAGQQRPVGTDPRGIAAGDFNEDGVRDLAVANFGSNSVAILTGLTSSPGVGAGTFSIPLIVSTGVGSGPAGIAAGDLNGDGITDLAVATQSIDMVTLLIGQGSGGVGNGNFVLGSAFAAGDAPHGILLADFNEDGILDIATCNANSNNVSILIGQGANGVGNASFAAAVNYAVGTTPVSLVEGDFNQDGILDLAVSTEGSTSLYVLLGQATSPGHGSGTFSASTPFSVGAGSEDIVTGDFNRDGIADLAVTEGTNVAVLRGNGAGGVGNGTFGVAFTYSTGSGQPFHLATADFDMDGIADLAVTMRAVDSLQIMLGGGLDSTGDGSFAAAIRYGTGDSPLPLAINDFLEDGRPDVATANQLSNDIRIFTGACETIRDTTITLTSLNGGGSVLPGTEASLSWTKGGGVIAVDLDISRDNGVNWQRIASHVTRNNFVWTVTPPITAQARLRVSDSTLPNRKRESALPFAVCDLFQSAPVAAPTFTAGAFPQGVSTGDFNEDGITDLAVACSGSSSVRVLLGNGAGGVGDGTFAPAVNYTASGVQGHEILPIDVNSDGITDLLLGHSSGIAVLRGLGAAGVGNGTFQYVSAISQTSPAGALIAGDFNEDGILDLAMGSPNDNNLRVALGNGANGAGDGSFQAATLYFLGGPVSGVASGDFNEDGILDLALVNGTDVGVLLGQGAAGKGNGGFAAPVHYASASAASSIVVGDFNSDGRLDLATVGGSNVAILPGGGVGSVGNGAFGPPSTYPAGASAVELALADFNGDGLADLAVSHSVAGTSTLSILLGNGSLSNGNGTFAAARDFAVGGLANHLAVGDFKEDGVPDIVTSGAQHDSLSVRLGTCPCAEADLFTLAKLPNGGEIFTVGSERQLGSSYGNGIVALNLDISWDGGANWRTVADHVPDASNFTWTVTRPVTGHALMRVADANVPSRFDVSDAFFNISTGGGVDAPELPARASLSPGLPNPFTRSVSFRLSLVEGGAGEAAIYDAGGRLVRALALPSLSPGEHELIWDGRGQGGREAPAGIYFLRVRFPGLEEVRKVVLAR